MDVGFPSDQPIMLNVSQVDQVYVEFMVISIVCNCLCLYLTTLNLWWIQKAISNTRSTIEKVSLQLKNYARLFVIFFLFYLLLQIGYLVLVFLLVNASPYIDIGMEFATCSVILCWIGMWREMVNVYIKKKFTRVVLNPNDKSIQTQLENRIQHLAGNQSLLMLTVFSFGDCKSTRQGSCNLVQRLNN